MALIKCSECGKEISDKANNCIHCGCPIIQTEEKYKIILKGSPNRIATVKVLMDIKNNSLAEAKAETDNPPKVLFNNLTLDEANEIVEKFKAINTDILLSPDNNEYNSTETETNTENNDIVAQPNTTQSPSVPNQNNKGCGIALGILIIIILLIALFSDSDSSSYDSKYSYDYNNDKEYRDNVNDIADIYGEDAEDVDRMLQAIEDEMNK